MGDSSGPPLNSGAASGSPTTSGAAIKAASGSPPTSGAAFKAAKKLELITKTTKSSKPAAALQQKAAAPAAGQRPEAEEADKQAASGRQVNSQEVRLGQDGSQQDKPTRQTVNKDV